MNFAYMQNILDTTVDKIYRLIGYSRDDVVTYGKFRISASLKSNRKFQHLRELVYKDELTGLLNRRAFLEGAERSIQSATILQHQLNLVFIDVDNFKQINDTYGHAAGDEALIKLAQLLKSSLRGSDIIARIGGDEFCIVIAGNDNTEVNNILSRLKQKISHVQVSEHWAFTCSYGISAFLKDGITTDDLYKAADNAMYANKRMKYATE
ncbi:GGDEF domain-containing protein [Agaribacter marinus]|uniref:diguanylate cyclase n=1 Tax=Agaribacter marinus TaxID=1431249 RepID=A0AA37SUS2_9ALTE|nr:GGDEF domain-containing protein [Agaribacter marinus]GLR69607.1 hypothetical protein GCM10007852_05150 [Agaribacter marinus]